MNFNKCYKLFRTKLPQIEASVFCSEEGGMLTEPKTHIESEFLESYISDKNNNLEAGLEKATEVWVGFRQVDPDDPVFFSKFEGKRLVCSTLTK